LKEIDTMTVPVSIDPALPWIEQIDRAEQTFCGRC
jgi:hypothetical protein